MFDGTLVLLRCYDNTSSGSYQIGRKAKGDHEPLVASELTRRAGVGVGGRGVGFAISETDAT